MNPTYNANSNQLQEFITDVQKEETILDFLSDPELQLLANMD